MKFPVPLLLLAFLISPVFAEDQTLIGVARGAGDKVRVIIHLKNGVPRTVDLDYAPVVVHPNRNGDHIPSLTTRDGLPSWEFTERLGQGELTESSVRIKVGRPDRRHGIAFAPGRMIQHVRSTYSYSGFQTWAFPNATSMSDRGNESVIVDSGVSPVTEPTREWAGIQEMEARLSRRAAGKTLEWQFPYRIVSELEIFRGLSFVSSVEMLLERKSPTRWKLTLKTVHAVLATDLLGGKKTESRALLHAR